MNNLEAIINLPCLKLNIPEDSLNFHTLERIVFNLTRKLGQALMEEFLQMIDDQLKTERKRGELSNQGKRWRYMNTLLGDITFYKRMYQDEGGKYRYLLDEALGLTKNQWINKSCQKLEGLLAFTFSSYRKAEALLWEFLETVQVLKAFVIKPYNKGKGYWKKRKKESTRNS